MVRVQTFGGLTVRSGTAPLGGATAQPRRLALLAIIGRAGERGVTRDRLVALLWPDAPEETARRALKQAIYALRRDLGGDDAIEGTKEVRLNPDLVACDVAEFETLLRSGRREQAAALVEGPFLDGFRLPGAPEFERWVEEQRTSLHHTWVDALLRLARDAEAAGRPDAAVRFWRRLAAADPLNARVAIELMTALARSGDTAGALQHARIFEALMLHELDMPPDAAVIELADRLRREAPAAQRPPGIIAEPVRSDARAAVDAAAGHVAVLPFDAIGSDPATAELAAGLVEEVLHALANIAGLSVSVGDARARSARHIVHGSVRLHGGHARVVVRLADPHGVLLWSARFEHGLADAFSLQDRVAAAVAQRFTDHGDDGPLAHVR